MDVSLDRFFGFELEVEHELEASRVTNTAVRNIVAIARGRLELARDYGVALDVTAVERGLAAAAEMIGDEEWKTNFLCRLRAAGGWARNCIAI